MTSCYIGRQLAVIKIEFGPHTGLNTHLWDRADHVAKFEFRFIVGSSDVSSSGAHEPQTAGRGMRRRVRELMVPGKGIAVCPKAMFLTEYVFTFQRLFCLHGRFRIAQTPFPLFPRAALRI